MKEFFDVLNSVLMLLGGVGVFIVGMIILSESIQRNASKGLRTLFKKIGNNRFAGMGIGTGVTALIQSSSATTVMVIGLINAGLLSLFQGTAIIMGANIGTTVTGLLVSFNSLSFFKYFKLKYFFMLMGFIGAMMKLISSKNKVKKIGDVLIGFGVIFIGLEFMSMAFEGDSAVSRGFQKLFENKSINFPLLLIVIGAIFTALIQSSSAATGIFIVLIGQQLLPLKSAMFLILGANMGTCITAVIASFGANTNAKRAALIHFMFNFIGTLIFTVILWSLADYILKPYQKAITNPEMQLAVFHIIFNVGTTLMLIGFIKPLNKLAVLLIKEKADDPDILKTYYIDERLLSTPSIAIEQTLKEIIGISDMALENLDAAFATLIDNTSDNTEKILKNESRINHIYRELAKYLVKISTLPISIKDEKLLGGLHHVINDIERIGDHAKNLLETSESMREHQLEFSEAAKDELKNMYAKVTEMYALSMEVFKTRKPGKLKTVSRLEDDVDGMKRQLTNAHVMRLNAGQCSFENGEDFYSVIMDLERIADHLTNIAFSIRSYTGSQADTSVK